MKRGIIIIEDKKVSVTYKLASKRYQINFV